MSLTLLSPVHFGALKLRNRVIMAPLTRCRADNPGYVPNDLMLEYYKQRASAGMIVAEGAMISESARGYPHTPGIYTDEQIAGWKRITDAIHAAGGVIVCQLWHCGRMSLPEYHGGEAPVAPSAINPEWKLYTPHGMQQTGIPRAATKEDIRQIVADFDTGAKNAIAAGFDGIEIHSSSGYLLHQFFARCSNTRSDEYGGSHENRARIFFEVLDAIGKHVPFDRVGFRLNPMMNRSHGIVVDDDTVPMWEYLICRANDYGLAYLHLTEPFLPGQLDGNPWAIHEVSARFRPLADMPIIANGGFSRDKAEEWINADKCQAVAFGRDYISNPDLVERFASGAAIVPPDVKTFYQGGARGYTDYPRA